MSSILKRLNALPSNIRVGITGIGSIGTGLVYQCGITPGIECVAIADIKIDRAIACAHWLKRDYVVVHSIEEINASVNRQKLAVTDDGLLIAQCDLIDVFLDASNSITAGAQFAVQALECEKHVVMMNSEADLTYGPFLLRVARDRHVVYTSADGDQPALIKHLIDEIRLWGFEVVMAGNIKGYLDRYANPTTIIPEADKRKLDYKMCTSYTDGSKLCVEMALVANAIGARVSVPGMHGPRANEILQVFDLFDFEALWKSGQPVVDYVLGAKPTGGVFVVGYTDSTYQQETLSWFPPQMGPGPFYLFYRPYHLGHIEAMACIAQAFLDREPVLEPASGFQTNVYAYAKRNLDAGERLDGFGGYTCYGLVENCSQNDERPGIPICLSEGVILKHDIAKDQKIYASEVIFDASQPGFELFLQAASKRAKSTQAGDLS